MYRTQQQDYVELLDMHLQSFSTSGMTLSVWIKVDQWHNPNDPVLGFEGTSWRITRFDEVS